jgi:uncharacterized membrane protein
METTKYQNASRISLAIFMIIAGIGHLTINRIDFQAQVPNWLPIDKDLVVLISGVLEISLGIAIGFWKKGRIKMGWILAGFFVLIFPGNIAHYINGTDAFGILNTDSARLTRLFFQPLLIAWPLWVTGAWAAWRNNKA